MADVPPDQNTFNLVANSSLHGLASNAEQSFSTPTVDRAQFTVVQGNRTVTKRLVMFNPNDVTDTKGTSWGSVEIPGASHPVYQFGAGGERLIAFDLYIDGDRGRFGRAQGRAVDSLSIADELRFYRALVYPTNYGQQFVNVSPATVLYTMGELYQGLPCGVKKADWKIHHWTPRMQPVRAVISLQLFELPSSSVASSSVFNFGGT